MPADWDRFSAGPYALFQDFGRAVSLCLSPPAAGREAAPKIIWPY